MNITLVRHGETIENVLGIIQGQLPGTLSDNGLSQVKQTALLLKDAHFDIIYCSDLQRCVDTLKAIQVYHPSTPVHFTKELRERKGGTNEGKPLDRHYWESLPGTEYSRRYPGGESWEDVKVRIKPFLNDIYQKHPTADVLLVTHGGPVRSIRSYFEAKSLAVVDSEGTPNAGIWRYSMDKPL